MNKHAIIRTEPDGTKVICPRCDPLRTLRDFLDQQDSEWRAGMCSKHKTEMHEEAKAYVKHEGVTEEQLLKKLNGET